ncbi:MAG: transglycosylase SLT domain-containing protein [Thiovulaceae bacterium]|nr:transglycosylase SLT domain-containing protein [Sulfurimonadaceae bacterium]
MIRYLLLLLLSTFLSADVTQKQITTLQIIRDIAKEIPDYKGQTYENTLSAICLTESSAGMHILGDFVKGKDITKASFGVMQIQVETARFIAQHTPELSYLLNYSDKRIATILLTDVRTSAKIAAHLLARFKKSRKKFYYMVSGYNGGWKNRPYYRRVMRNYRQVTRLVKKGVLD